MIELERHIEILLLANDCVIVPGLGGFMAHHVEARYDTSDNLFLPPLRTLGFNPQLKLNDSLLAQSYIEAYDISYPEAVRRIGEEVEELKQHLYNNGSYELNDIGILSVNEENNIVFDPCESGILSPALYGLSSFEIKALDHTNEIDKPLNEQVSAVDSEAASDTYENQTQSFDVTATENTYDDDSTIKIKVAWIRNAVAMAAAFVAFLFITTPISNSNSKYVIGSVSGKAVLNAIHDVRGNAPVAITTKQIKDAIARKDSMKQSHETIKQTVSATDSAETGTINRDKYCIILASHITSRNADNFVNELKEKGFADAYVYKHNNIIRVAYGEYGSEAEAYTSLRTIRENKELEQAWVYKKR